MVINKLFRNGRTEEERTNERMFVCLFDLDRVATRNSEHSTAIIAVVAVVAVVSISEILVTTVESS